jgi:hypothetical protein
MGRLGAVETRSLRFEMARKWLEKESVPRFLGVASSKIASQSGDIVLMCALRLAASSALNVLIEHVVGPRISTRQHR